MREMAAIRSDALALLSLYRSGALGGETMPEDANPQLDPSSKENYLYFTLPMALNYQRNSYALWEGAKQTYCDPQIAACFSPEAVARMSMEVLQSGLIKYKVALQPNKQPEIWKTLCITLCDRFDGDIRNLMIRHGFRVESIKAAIAADKRAFPYLGGGKIVNYWLSVLERYTDARFVDRHNITVAPDTHVMKASIRLGVAREEELSRHDIRDVIAGRWSDILAGTGLCPIDIHTPLWLWSRGKFAVNLQ